MPIAADPASSASSTSAIGLLFFAIANFAYQAALIYYDALPAGRGAAARRGGGCPASASRSATSAPSSSGLLFKLTTDANGDSTAASFLLVGSLFADLRGADLPARAGAPAAREQFRGDRRAPLVEPAPGHHRAHARQTPGLLRFIVGRFFYSDPVNTAIVVMSAFATQAIGFTSSEALNILLLLTVVAVIASFGWGWLTDRIGPKRDAPLGPGLVDRRAAAAGPGARQGPVPARPARSSARGWAGVAVTDRLLLLRLAPPEQVGEMLGLYGLAGKFSAVIGPIAYGSIVALLLGPLGKAAYQIAILSLLVLMVIGFADRAAGPRGASTATRRRSWARRSSRPSCRRDEVP